MNEAFCYCLISPCRDEAAYARRTLQSVTSQSVAPALWVIVDDGSTDATPQILAEYAAKFHYIRILRREITGERSVGPGVIDAFYAGLKTVDTSRYDYLCKLDLDLDLPHRYFESLLHRMRDNPRIGTCSGKAYFPDSRGRLISEACGDEMSVGMSKFYRRQCFEEIGGFVREVMWDGIDCHRCRMLGWIACSWDGPDLRFTHLRPMGSSHKGILTGRMRHGYGQYYMGSSILYMTASAIFRMTRPPRVIGGIAMWWGYLRSMLLGLPRYEDLKFRKFLRQYQHRCLWFGKATATRRLHEQRAKYWKQRHEQLSGASNNRDHSQDNVQTVRAS